VTDGQQAVAEVAADESGGAGDEAFSRSQSTVISVCGGDAGFARARYSCVPLCTRLARGRNNQLQSLVRV
jgi:hypothetical protein